MAGAQLGLEPPPPTQTKPHALTGPIAASLHTPARSLMLYPAQAGGRVGARG